MKKYVLLLLGTLLIFFACQKKDATSPPSSETDKVLEKLAASIPKSIHISDASKTVTIVKRNGKKETVKDRFSTFDGKVKSIIGNKNQFALQTKALLPSGFSSISSDSRTAFDGWESGGGGDPGDPGDPDPTDDPNWGSEVYNYFETVYDAVATKTNDVYTSACCYQINCWPTNGDYYDSHGNHILFDINVCCVRGDYRINASGSSILVMWWGTRTLWLSVNGKTKTVQTDLYNEKWF